MLGFGLGQLMGGANTTTPGITGATGGNTITPPLARRRPGMGFGMSGAWQGQSNPSIGGANALYRDRQWYGGGRGSGNPRPTVTDRAPVPNVDYDPMGSPEPTVIDILGDVIGGWWSGPKHHGRDRY